MLELIPTGGLCNKLRAIDSAISFCSTHDIPLKVYWIRDKKLINCQFRDLFEPIPNLNLIEMDDLPFKLRKGDWRNLYIPNLLKKLPNYGTVFKRWEIKDFNNQGGDFKQLYDKHNRHLIFFTFSRFFRTEREFEIFKPKPFIQNMIREETKTFDQFTIGIHIRRTDHRIAIKNSPIEFFEKNIEAEISKNDRMNFYLASDCADSKMKLKDKYGDRLQTNFESGDRTSLQGMYRAITELYALASTSKVYGSTGSSFSTTACSIGNIEQIILDTV